MGIYLAENLLDLDRTSPAAFRAALAAKGLSSVAAATEDMLTAVSTGLLTASQDPEQRTWPKFTVNPAGSSTSSVTSFVAIAVPPPPYYLSFRILAGTEVGNSGNSNVWPFVISTATSVATSFYLSVDATTKSLRIGGLSGATIPSFEPGKVNTIEILHAADNTIKIWLNDLPVGANPVVAASTTGFIYFGARRGSAVSAANAINYPIAINDIVVVDPSTPGLQYRPGRSVRVESMDFTADDVAQWALPAGVTGSHYPLMNLPYRGTVPTNEQLASMTIGAEELYSAAALRTDLGSKVYAVQLEGQFSNGAAAAHVLTLNGNFGAAGKAALRDLTIPIGGVPQYNRVVLNKNPNGNTDWTLATATAPKVGFSIKS